MNIGLINEYFPPFAPGGAEWSMLQLAEELASRGHRVVVITPNYGAAPSEEWNGVRVYRFDYRARVEPGQTTVRFRWLANPIFYLYSARKIERIARHEQLDILHAQNKYSLPGTWLAARRLDIPAVYTIRDATMICPMGQCLLKYELVHPECGHWRHWWRDCRSTYIDNYLSGARRNLRVNAKLIWLWLDSKVRRWFLRRADAVVGVSQGILDVHHMAGVQTGQRDCVVYNLPPEIVHPSDEELAALRAELGLESGPTVLYVGKFSRGKGTTDLMTAIPFIAQLIPEVQVLFVGKGNLSPSDPHARVLGSFPHPTVVALYHLADVVVTPSVAPESLSRVLLEAMAAGRPVVGTRVGGTPELIEDGVNGRLVERSNPAQLAGAITDLLLDEGLRARMGQASRELVQTRFASEVSLERLLGFYHQAIARRRGQGR